VRGRFPGHLIQETILRETLIFQGILTLIGIAFVVAGIGYLSTSVPLGVLGAMGGLLIIVGAVKMAVRKKRAQERR